MSTTTATQDATDTTGLSWVERIATQVPLEPDPDAFDIPPGPRGTKMHVVNERGHVAGYIAAWDALHRGQNIPPPRDPYGGTYPKFHRHRIRTSDGGVVMTGPIATNGHGDAATAADMSAVIAHYDDPTYVAANVRVIENDIGIWASGALRPGVSPFQVAMLDTYSQSGHWLPGPSGSAEIDGELVASCCVTVEGFELDPEQAAVSTLVASAGHPVMSLAAAENSGLVGDDGRCVALTAAGVVSPTRATTFRSMTDTEMLRAVQRAQNRETRVTRARRRMSHPQVTAAAARVRGEDT